MNLLITAIGSFSSDVAIKNCHQLGMKVIGCDIYPMEWVAQSLDVDTFYQVDKAVDEEKYISQILDIIKNEEINLLLPSTDAEVDVLNKHRDELKEAGVILCISGPKTVEFCRDKIQFAKRVGKYAIKSEMVADVPYPEFPVVVKPVNGRSSQGMQRIYDQVHYDLVAKDYMVQPLIEGDIITVDVVRHPKSGYVEAVARQELLRTPSGAGTSVKIINDWELEALCKEIAEELRIIGCVCFEFIRDEDGMYHMLECNPRLSGGVAFSCLAGYDFIKAHFDCFISDDIEVKGEIPEMFIARKYQEYII
ncbi:MAG: ATP-grasp domain-containing protein [Lachnospiraceae bacterium]|nr:ATP-grasp domain-containing protein [Lachnospiraceae bacterium]